MLIERDEQEIFFSLRSVPKFVKYYVAMSWCWSCNFQFVVCFVCSGKLKLECDVYVNVESQTYLQENFEN